MSSTTSPRTKQLIETIVSEEAGKRDQPLERLVAGMGRGELLEACRALEEFRKQSTNLYHSVRALFFLYALHRFHLPLTLQGRESGQIPFAGYEKLLSRRFQEAIREFLIEQESNGPSITLSSALAHAYHQLAFQTLADQVRRSVRTVSGNQWMFRTGHPDDLPLRIRKKLLERKPDGSFPLLREQTSVRMDFTHSGWSDIFFLGMDFPEGARVINASVDLAVKGRHGQPAPPIECALRVIEEPVLRLVSIDLAAVADVSTLGEVFDFARDYLGLLKAAIIASGLIPPGLEGCDASIDTVLSGLLGPGRGLEIVSRVNDIPKGSRLAVSTNLLGSLISLCMRATNQVADLEGGLNEEDRRIVAARAILGEWIGGSGGGWQDSGGIWPGIKLIHGAKTTEGDPEFGISRGRLLPNHHVFSDREIAPETRQQLQDSLVLVHGGMAQNVGPILEMVTEKYLLRSPREWEARQDAMAVLDEMIDALQEGDLQRIGKLTGINFREPLQEIIPWCSNLYTELLIEQSSEKYGDDFWGFWMLGGMAGGGMGFIFDPRVKSEAAEWLGQTMLKTKKQLESSLPFAMDPVVYDFEINDGGTVAGIVPSGEMPAGYYELMIPRLLRHTGADLTAAQLAELSQVHELCESDAQEKLPQRLMRKMLPAPNAKQDSTKETLRELLEENGFDPIAHEQLREDIRLSKLGLSQNRLAPSATIEDVSAEEILDVRVAPDGHALEEALATLANNEVAVLTLAAGVGSRWTQGAGVVKALHPFSRLGGHHRNFLEVHLAKSRRVGIEYGAFPTHIVATGYMTHAPIAAWMKRLNYSGKKILSKGSSVGLRMIPTQRDLRFAWESLPQQVLDEQQEKVRQSTRAALLNWAAEAGEAEDYTDNVSGQCLHPVGHWYEVPNLLRNGVLHTLLQEQPQLRYLMLHNVDTLGAELNPRILAHHISSGACLSFEVIPRRLEDRGGGLARVDGRVRLVEGLAMPNERDEFKLSYYNSMTTWIDLDLLLEVFGLSRGMLDQREHVDAAIRRLGRRLPTYLTLKDVKKRWGNGQEDVYPVSQFEKLWSDMTSLPEIDCRFLVVPTVRGQQLKEQAQLDGWLRDGSAAYIDDLCAWDD
ncbi:MAG: UTP--glucose-1-phosphate uridylyltransferase [Planctomycetota bacterium]